MRPKTFALVLFLLGSPITTWAQQDLSIEIDGKPYDVVSNQPFTYITEGGEKVTFTIQMSNSNAIESKPSPIKGNKVKGQLFSLKIPNHYGLAVNQPMTGVKQYTVINGNGSGLIIQEFTTVDPAAMKPIYLQQLIGQPSTGTVVTITLDDKRLNGLYSEQEQSRYVVYSLSDNHRGVLLSLVGQHEDSNELAQILKTIKWTF